MRRDRRGCRLNHRPNLAARTATHFMGGAASPHFVSAHNGCPRDRAVNVGRLKVGRCNEADIPYIMATERITGYEDLVGRWDAARHQAALADGRHAYFVARDGSEPVGFAIMRDWAAPERVTLLKRMAVSRPGI